MKRHVAYQSTPVRTPTGNYVTLNLLIDDPRLSQATAGFVIAERVFVIVVH